MEKTTTIGLSVLFEVAGVARGTGSLESLRAKGNELSSKMNRNREREREREREKEREKERARHESRTKSKERNGGREREILSKFQLKFSSLKTVDTGG